jgi:excisionase family DNA binding protein
MTDPPGETYLTVAEVAAILKLNQQTIRNWIDAGQLPAVRVGQRRVRIKRSDFDRLLQRGYTGQTGDAQRPQAANIWDGELPPRVIP